MQTRNQKHAVEVFQKVEGLFNEGKEAIEELLKTEGEETQKVKKKRREIETARKKYGAMAHKLPVLIRTAGLAQALGFLDAKSKKESEAMNKRLLDDLASTLSKSSTQLLSHSRGDNNQSLGDYLRLTQETLAALLWYKRFAQSVLGVEQGERTGD